MAARVRKFTLKKEKKNKFDGHLCAIEIRITHITWYEEYGNSQTDKVFENNLMFSLDTKTQ